MKTEYGPAARQAAAMIAVIAGATLVLRLVLAAAEHGGVLGAVSHLSQFFTILTNTFICAMMAAIALGVFVGSRVAQALVVAIVGVGIVYHVALAHLVDFKGLALLADHGVHTVVPALSLLWWLFLAPKPRLELGTAVVWLIWPLVYCVYILLRATSSGFYPYPFLNLPELGVAGLAQSIFVLCLAFLVIGLLLTGLGRLFAGRLQPS